MEAIIEMYGEEHVMVQLTEFIAAMSVIVAIKQQSFQIKEVRWIKHKAHDLYSAAKLKGKSSPFLCWQYVVL